MMKLGGGDVTGWSWLELVGAPEIEKSLCCLHMEPIIVERDKKTQRTLEKDNRKWDGKYKWI